MIAFILAHLRARLAAARDTRLEQGAFTAEYAVALAAIVVLAVAALAVLSGKLMEFVRGINLGNGG